MTEILTGSAFVYKELGALAFLILAAVIGLAFLIWRITVTQDRITMLLDKLFLASDLHCQSLAVHDRQGQGIADDIADIKDQTTRIDTNVQMLIQQGARK